MRDYECATNEKGGSGMSTKLKSKIIPISATKSKRVGKSSYNEINIEELPSMCISDIRKQSNMVVVSLETFNNLRELSMLYEKCTIRLQNIIYEN